jgi:DNA/RNA endonuclease YhcR with UshA esterase domain
VAGDRKRVSGLSITPAPPMTMTMQTHCRAVLACLLLLAGDSATQGQNAPTNSIPATEARTMIGTNAVIRGKVAEVYKTEKLIRINFEAKYPNQVFTAVVFAKDFTQFTNTEALEGKTVEVLGRVVEFKDRPEIILTNRTQLRLTAKLLPPSNLRLISVH